MLTSKFTPKLYFRKDKVDCEGRMPLFIRFPRLDGKEPKFSVGKLRLSSDEWDSKTNLPKDEMLRTEIEKKMQRIKLEIHRCIIDDVPITFSKLRDIVKDKKTADPLDNLFLQYYREYLGIKERNGQIGQSTMKGHIYMMSAIKEFNPRLRVKDINADFIKKFVVFLKNRRIAKGRTVENLNFSKQLVQIRTIVRYISAKGIMVQDPFKSGEIFIKPCKRSEVYLDEKELSKMVKLSYNNKLTIVERRILMMYLLSCTTGIRISDMRALKWCNLNLNCSNGVFEFICKKTKRKVFVPLSPMARDIICYTPEGDLDNVDNNLSVFVKVYSPTKINGTLKSLARMVGISKEITFHSARRTFATQCFMNGISEIIIGSFLGHKPKNVTDRYRQWNTYEANKIAPKLSFLDLKKLRKLA